MNSASVGGEKPSLRARYADLFDRLLDAAFLLNAETFEVIEANDACERVLGDVHRLQLGASILQLVELEQREAVAKKLRMARRRYYPTAFDLELRGSTRMVLQVSVSQLELLDGISVIQLIARDVTDERDAQEKIKKYVEELKDLNQKLEALSVTDEMTGLSNFRYFSTRLKAEHDQVARYGGTYSVIFCDVDNFKHYNDRNGHPAGDEVLRRIAAILKDKCRNTDLPARYGGEEMTVLCPHTDEAGAKVLAERIRQAIQADPIEHANAQPLGFVSVSVGVASFPASGSTADDVLKAADSALYRSKHSGKNRVTGASDL